MSINESLFYRILWLTLAIKLVFAAWIPLTGDEAYFITWGKNLDYGYYDHPPMVGWWLAAMLQVSDAVSWLRLPSVLLTTFIGWAIYRLASNYSQMAAVFAASLFLLSPVNLIPVLITTDTPLILFSFLSAWCFYLAQRGDQLAWYLASGVLLGLAFTAKFFAGLLGIAYFIYLVLFVRRGLKPFIGLALVVAGTLPFIVLNLAWNYNHCWDNYLFNFVNRTGDAGFSFDNLAVYLLMLVYLLTPPVFYYLLRDYRDIAATLSDNRKRIYAALFLIPILLFLLLSLWKKIGLHWLLSFYPFLFIALVHIFTEQQWRRSFNFMLVFSALHVIAFAALLVTIPGVLTSRPAIHQSVVFATHNQQVVEQLNHLAPAYQWVANSYGESSTLSYTARRHVLLFGEGSFHGRQDDKLTDYRELDGKDFLIFKFSNRLEQFRPYFTSMQTGSFLVEGATFYYARAQGFKYGVYREKMLEYIMQSYYRLPAALPVGACYMFDKYRDPSTSQ